MRYVIGIDVGLRNLGFCVWDCVLCKFVHWANESLVTPRYTPSRLVAYVHEFMQKHQEYFDNAHCILVERQMRCAMRIVEAAFQSRHYEKCIILQPRCVKTHYDILKRDYVENKKSAVEWVDRFCRVNPSAFCVCTDAYLALDKRDDMADALMLVLYYLDTYSNQLAPS